MGDQTKPTESVRPGGAHAFSIRQAESEADLSIIRQLFTVYTNSLGIDLSFQSYAEELASLPGVYESPKGALLLASTADGTALGCIAVRALPYEHKDGTVCEAKRLYVTPESRGKGVGRALIQAAIGAAKTAGYREMKLDTLPSMRGAQALYRSFGFSETNPYYHNPHEGVMYMSCDLAQTEGP